MGTKVQSKSYLPGYHSMRDLNEASNSINWPIYHGDKTLSNGQYYNGFVPGIADAYAGYDKDVVKRTMLEHEAIFKNQVYELHRVYRIQRDLMNEIKRKELQKNRIPLETSLSSCPLASQVTSEDARKWGIPGFPLSNSVSTRPSVSGAEDMHSHFSPLKGNSAQGCSFPSQNGSSSKSKDIEVLESRPTKVRRKMFDLHLPAEEYIDTEEGVPFRERKASEMSSCVPNKNHDIAPEGRVKLLLDDAGKNGCERDASRSDSNLRSTNGLADLNEPFLAEETHAPAYVDLLSTSSHRELRGHELSATPSSQFLGVSKEMLANSRSSNENNVNLYTDNNGNGKVWFPHVPETGQSKSIVKSASQGFHPGKLPLPSQPMQTLFNKTHEPPNFRTDQSKIDLCRERTNCGLSTSGTTGDASTYNRPESFMTYHTPIMHPAAPSPDLAKSWSQSVLSWEKPNGIISQRSMPVQSHPSFNLSSALSNISHTPSTQSHENFGDTQHLTRNSGANLGGFRKEFPNQNGFYHGSSSGSKESQVPRSSVSHDYPNCNSGNGVPDLFATLSSSKYFNSSNCVKSAKGMDLNVMLSTSSSNEAASLHGDRFADGETNHKDHFVGLPWLRSKPGNKNGATNSGRDLNNWESTFIHSAIRHPNKQFSQNMQSLSSSNDAADKSVGNADWLSNKKILGFPIFEKPHTSEKELSLTSSLSLPRPTETVETKKSRLFDMNLPCDAVCPDSSIEKRMADEKVSAFRCLIDLNSCLSEDEASIAPFGPSKVKTVIHIDLEVPAVLETEENLIQGEENLEEKAEHEEHAKMAAEAIIDISSFVHKSHTDASMPDPLSWFVDIASSYGDEIEEIRSNKDSSSEVDEVDFFECMTLKLAETKEEEYMPTPPAIDNLQAEEIGGGLLTTRPRRGQARRGRQRRDFQRDILPGLVSLSRHEVTEDLQTFGGIMRATGHSWQSGLGRRNGGGRGRRRAVASPPTPVAVAAMVSVSACTMQVNNNNMEVGVEERSLTGWGKTIRRPRRQRCPAGNPQSLLLS